MKNIVTLTFVCCYCFSTYAQADTSVWRTTKYIERNDYIFSIPEKWQRVDQTDQAYITEKFNFNTIALPVQVNDAPLTAYFTLRKVKCDDIAFAENYVVSEFTGYTDRTTAPGYNYDTDSINIKTGEKATVYSTRFYRRTKVSNYSRFDLVAYSAKHKYAYILTVTYQYKDPTYYCEGQYMFKDYALRVFRSLQLR
jgi:hypothetical protein